ncbi:zinc-finger domain of monoamine-oxidase A repressor R1, partial [Tanacetum coccineum]
REDEIAKAIIANDGVPITTKEHDSVVSKIKKKAAEAHAEMLECQKMGPEDKQKPDAVRIVPIFKDNKGHMYWRLKGCSDNPGILLQDIGTGDHMVGAADKWFGFDDEQIKLIEGQFKILRGQVVNILASGEPEVKGSILTPYKAGGPFLPLVEPEVASLPLVEVGLSTSQPPPYTVVHVSTSPIHRGRR